MGKARAQSSCPRELRGGSEPPDPISGPSPFPALTGHLGAPQPEPFLARLCLEEKAEGAGRKNGGRKFSEVKSLPRKGCRKGKWQSEDAGDHQAGRTPPPLPCGSGPGAPGTPRRASSPTPRRRWRQPILRAPPRAHPCGPGVARRDSGRVGSSLRPGPAPGRPSQGLSLERATFPGPRVPRTCVAGSVRV